MIALYLLGALALMALAVWFGFSWGFESRGAESLSLIVDSLDQIYAEQHLQTQYLADIAANTGS
jgi:hypothetical protein